VVFSTPFLYHFMKAKFLFAIAVIGIVSCTSPESKKEESANKKESTELRKLPSWNEEPRTRILNWFDEVTNEGSEDFIPVSDRIAVFDNDGTLWPEQPIPNQLQFAVDYLIANWENHPEWESSPVLSGVVKGDMTALKKAGMEGLIEVIDASHSGITEMEFNKNIEAWADTAKNERFDKLFVDILYQPMLELLEALREHEFKTFIVSGGGADFMRVWTKEKYGIPPYQVVGSYGELAYEVKDGEPIITKVAGDIYVDDKGGKPQAIHRFIGKVPVFCGGNSDGDQAMMQYTHSSPYNSMCVILHHTDAEREYAYDTITLSGHLESALIEAKEKNWMVVDMKEDFKQIFPFD